MTSLIVALTFGQILLQDEGGTAAYVKKLDCVGSSIVCSAAAAVGTVTVNASATTPAAPNLSVQFNDNGAFGGANEVLIDGGLVNNVVQTSHPAWPRGNVQVPYEYAGSFDNPPRDTSIDQYFRVPVPVGLFGSVFTNYGTLVGWDCNFCRPAGYSNAAVACTNLAGGGTISSAGTASGVAWGSGSMYARGRTAEYAPASGAANLWAGPIIATALQGTNLGPAGNAGGFKWCTRFKNVLANVDGLSSPRVFVGLINRTTALTNTAPEPVSYADTIFVGGNSWATSLGVYSNDNVSTATLAAALGSNFPIASGAYYDVCFSAAPSDGGTGSVEYEVLRLDSAQYAHGSITSDLPRNTVQLNWQVLLGNGIDGGIVNLGWQGTAVCHNQN